MNLFRVPFETEGNPNYPLPSDYDALTLTGQRDARVNACRQWLLPVDSFPQIEGMSRRLVKQMAAVAALDFFDTYYLWPSPEHGFDPQFYDDPPVATPDFHFNAAGPWYTDRCTIDIFPRGGGKTTLCRKDMILRLITRPMYSFVYSTSSHDNSMATGQAVKDQCYYNQRIQDDFAAMSEFEGRIKPTRGDKGTGVELFYLSSGSWLQCISAESRQRGKRPRRYRLDDPEYDEKKSTSMSAIRDYMATLIFKVVYPMVTRAGVGVDWLGTYVSQRHYLWHATSMEDTPQGPRAKDPRFNYWTRFFQRGAEEVSREDKSGNKTTVMISCWPEMWPGSKAERLEKAKTDPAYAEKLSMEELKERLGAAIFNAEVQGKPGRSDDSFFPALTEDAHGYSITDADPNLDTRPRFSNAMIRWKRRGEPVSMLLSEFLSESSLFMCCDYAGTHRPDSDFKTAWLMAHLPVTNELFILEGWHGRVKKETQISNIFRMVDKWKIPRVCPEVIKESVVLYNDLLERTQTRAMDLQGGSFVPRIRAIRPGMEPKTEKIASLHLRFEHALIKFPWWLRSQDPYLTLFDQIESFNPEVENGGLAKDDDLDTIAMSKFVLKGRRKKRPQPDTSPKDPVKEIIAGSSTVHGHPIGVGVNWNIVPLGDISQILARQSQGSSDGSTKV